MLYGLGISFNSYGLWYLRGVLNRYIPSDALLSASNRTHATFINVGNFLKWIRAAYDDVRWVNGSFWWKPTNQTVLNTSFVPVDISRLIIRKKIAEMNLTVWPKIVQNVIQEQNSSATTKNACPNRGYAIPRTTVVTEAMKQKPFATLVEDIARSLDSSAVILSAFRCLRHATEATTAVIILTRALLCVVRFSLFTFCAPQKSRMIDATSNFAVFRDNIWSFEHCLIWMKLLPPFSCPSSTVYGGFRTTRVTWEFFILQPRGQNHRREDVLAKTVEYAVRMITARLKGTEATQVSSSFR